MASKVPRFYRGTKIDGPHLLAEQLFVRSTDLNELIGRVGYTEALFHILQGRLPDPEERELFDIVLVAFHGGFGLLPPTTLVPRLVAGTGVSTSQALAAGYLASGPYHVGAVEQAMGLYSRIFEAYRAESEGRPKTSGDLEQFAYDDISGMIDRGETIPGYGHPLLRKDPRPTHTRRVLCERGYQHPYYDVFDGVVRCMQERKGVPANVDGITAAILLRLGFRVEHGTGLFLLARTAAMLAHIVEEQTDMPYQTQRRLMLVPVALPHLFNLNFKRLGKFFNRFRDNRVFRGIHRVLTLNAGGKYRKREAEGQKAIAEFRASHTERDLSQELAAAPPAAPAGRDEFVAASQRIPESSANEAVECEELQDELGDVESSEILGGAASLIAASLERIGSHGTPPEGGRRRAAEMLEVALQLVQDAAALVDGESRERVPGSAD